MAGITQVFLFCVFVALTYSLPHHHHFKHHHDNDLSALHDVPDVKSVLNHVEKRFKRSPKDIVPDSTNGGNTNIVFAEEVNSGNNNNPSPVNEPNKMVEVKNPNNDLNRLGQGNNNNNIAGKPAYTLVQSNDGQYLLVPLDNSQYNNGQIIVPQQISQGPNQVFLSNDNNRNVPQNYVPTVNNKGQNGPQGNGQVYQNVPQGQVVYTNNGQIQSNQNIPQGNPVYVLDPQNRNFEIVGNGQNRPNGQIVVLNNNPQNIPLSNGQVLVIPGNQGGNSQNIPLTNGQIVVLGNGQNIPQNQGQLYILSNGQYIPIANSGQILRSNGQDYNSNSVQGIPAGAISIGTTPNKDIVE